MMTPNINRICAHITRSFWSFLEWFIPFERVYFHFCPERGDASDTYHWVRMKEPSPNPPSAISETYHYIIVQSPCILQLRGGVGDDKKLITDATLATSTSHVPFLHFSGWILHTHTQTFCNGRRNSEGPNSLTHSEKKQKTRFDVI